MASKKSTTGRSPAPAVRKVAGKRAGKAASKVTRKKAARRSKAEPMLPRVRLTAEVTAGG